MPKYSIVILESVEKTIRNNFDYIANALGNESAAYAHTADIYRLIMSLETFPERYQIYEGYPNPVFRVARIRQYRIFYQVNKKRKIIYIVDLMHSHQNPEDLDLGSAAV